MLFETTMESDGRCGEGCTVIVVTNVGRPPEKESSGRCKTRRKQRKRNFRRIARIRP